MTKIIDNPESGRKPRRRLKDEKQPENNMCLDAFLEAHKTEDNNLTMAQRDGYLWCSSFRKILQTRNEMNLQGNTGYKELGFGISPIMDEIHRSPNLNNPKTFGKICDYFYNLGPIYSEKHETYFESYQIRSAREKKGKKSLFAFARGNLPRNLRYGLITNAAGEKQRSIQELEQDTYNFYFFFYRKDGSISDRALFIPMLNTDARIPEDKMHYGLLAFSATLKKFPTLEIEYESHSECPSDYDTLKQFKGIIKEFRDEIWEETIK